MNNQLQELLQNVPAPVVTEALNEVIIEYAIAALDEDAVTPRDVVVDRIQTLRQLMKVFKNSSE